MTQCRQGALLFLYATGQARTKPARKYLATAIATASCCTQRDAALSMPASIYEAGRRMRS
jgi:hypothetical protein